MSAEENKARSRRVIEAMNQQDLSVFDELYAPDVVVHSALMTTQGLEAYKQGLLESFTAFPDTEITIEDQVAEGDKSVIRFTESGTQQGDLMGIKASGKRFQGTGIAIAHHDASGKTVEVWISFDFLGMLQQLGVIPSLGQAS
ncbi:MAG TPA: ester cyclase [Ktedonobacteraceae bacterium]